jgi:hypothetical protein
MEVTVSYDVLLNRVRAEYLEMPGLRLKPEQVQRLLGVELTVCQRVLTMLVEAEFLCMAGNGTYALSTEWDDVPRPQPA